MIHVRAENLPSWAPPSDPSATGRYVKISIDDHGLGIPREYLQKVFDPYFTTKQRGSGLGLPIAYSIIRRHGGHIGLDSEPGKGTTATFCLPASTKEMPKEEDAKAALIPGKGRILVMDDEGMIRDLASALLAELGYEVALAKDGAEAIELYKQAKQTGHPFDAVVLDLTVPGGMGGKEAVQQLIEMDPNARAIVASGYSDDPVISQFRQYGFRGVITKPYSVEDISSLLSNILREA